MAKNKKLKKNYWLKLFRSYRKLITKGRNSQLPECKRNLKSVILTTLLLLSFMAIIAGLCVGSYKVLTDLTSFKLILAAALGLKIISWISDCITSVAVRLAMDEEKAVNFMMISATFPILFLGGKIAMISVICLAIQQDPTLPVLQISTRPQGFSSTR